jgi:hypothetical protein
MWEQLSSPFGGSGGVGRAAIGAEPGLHRTKLTTPYKEVGRSREKW